jgi:D-alanine-D-alanine ligase-like ATP-grasp enzyme
MNLLVLSQQDMGTPRLGEIRIRKMLGMLQASGFMTSHHIVQTRVELSALVEREQPDLVFDTAYHIKDPSGAFTTIHRILDEMKIPYVGSDAEALDLVLSKSRLKDRWHTDGIPTPAYCVLQKIGNGVRGLEKLLAAKAYPYILKPDLEGNSRGLSEASIVFDQTSLENQLSILLNQYDSVLSEHYLGMYPDFREFTVAMIGNGESRLILPAEIMLLRETKLRVVTTRDKDRHLTRAQPLCDWELAHRLTDLARRAFQSARVRDYARCDFLYAHGDLFAIEINGQPMLPDKWFEACTRGVGLNGLETVQAVMLAAIQRNIAEGYGYLKVPRGLLPLLNKLEPRL